MGGTDEPGPRAGQRGFDDLPWVALPGRDSADPLLGAGAAAGVSVRIVRLPAAAGRTPHRHPRSVEVVHVLEGHGVAWQDGSRRQVGPGDTVVIPTGVPHATLPAPGTTLLLVCFFPDGDLAANLEELDGPALDA